MTPRAAQAQEPELQQIVYVQLRCHATKAGEVPRDSLARYYFQSRP